MTIPQNRKKVKKKRASDNTKKRRRKKASYKPPKKKKARKKPPKPKPRPRRKISKKQRSQAAKKGWETRRARALLDRAAAARVETLKEFREQRAFFEQEHIRTQLVDRFVDKGIAGYFSKNLAPDFVETQESKILRSLIYAEQIGDFDRRAYELSAEYNWDVQEIYTLWHSP